MAPTLQKPQPSFLRIPRVPTFPLSSPITEEIDSPTTSLSSSEERGTETGRRDRPFEYLAKSSTRTNPFIHEFEYQTSRIGHGDVDGTHRAHEAVLVEVEEENDLKKPGATAAGTPRGILKKKNVDKPVGLNLVTDFTRSSPPKREDASARVSVPVPVPAQTHQVQVQASPFVDLNDLKQLSKDREQERSAQRIKGILKKNTTSYGFRRLPDNEALEQGSSSSYLDLEKKTSPRKKGKDDLSPSDRPIMIGFSGPFDDRKEKSKELDSAGSQLTPLTPSIIVTPAKEDAFWDGHLHVSPEHHRPRVASSVYSQPSPRLLSGEVPPVPAIPTFHSEDKPAQGSIASARKQRSYSTGTLFEEDDIPRSRVRSRSYSNESIKQTLDHLIVVTPDFNRHQSQGWWTYLLSPLLGRSGTVTSRKTATPTTPNQPPLPYLTTTSPESSVDWWDRSEKGAKEVSCFSPDTPEATLAERREAPSWYGAGMNPFADIHSIPNEADKSRAERGGASFMFPGNAIQGEAAEYYQACAHELFSRRPYFECVNHVCSITPKDKIPGFEASSRSVEGDNEKGLLIFTPEQPHTENPEGKQHSPPFDKAVSSPTPSSPQGAAIRKDADDIFNTTEHVDPPKHDAEVPLERGSPAPVTRGSPEMPAPAPLPMPGPPSEKQSPESFNQPGLSVPPPVTYIYYPPAPAPAPTTALAPVIHVERPPPQYIVVPAPHVPNPEVQKQPPVPASPGPISPGYQRETERSGGIAMSEMPADPAPAYVAREYNHSSLSSRLDLLPMTRVDMSHPVTERDRMETRRRRLEKEDAAARKAGGLWRGRCCIPKKGCFGRQGREGRLRRRWYLAISAFFLIIVIVAIILAIKLTRKGDETPVQSQWLNLTGYPPMPTGIATIAGSEPQVQNSGCISPPSLWSCALPKEEQAVNKPYGANEPNFRVEIRFRNGTYPRNTTLASRSNRHHLLRLRDTFASSPAAPDLKEQTFLGNTTDKNSAPFAGEETPFYITILSAIPLSSQPSLTRRSDSNSTNTTNPFPNLTSLIPSPATNPDGTAAPATLYPLPESQPIRLYNRGQDTEHYGFYTYFDRSIFLSSTASLTNNNTDSAKTDQDGGSSEQDANVRCTWAQTRFLVQIWTRPGKSGKQLLSATSTTTTSSPTHATSTSTSTPSSSSSATNFTRPGSFPYPVTITLDRHGGIARKKMVYCYGMESGERTHHINATAVKLQIEDRGFGGNLVNPAPGIFDLPGDDSSSTTNSSGWDGGTGGCMCQWVNWVSIS